MMVVVDDGKYSVDAVVMLLLFDVVMKIVSIDEMCPKIQHVSLESAHEISVLGAY
jgi:hypothetical protein